MILTVEDFFEIIKKAADEANKKKDSIQDGWKECLDFFIEEIEKKQDD